MSVLLISGVGLTLAAFPLAGFAEGLDAAAIARAAQGHDVVILGEIHDNPVHHRMQAEVSALIAPRAFVFEMLDAEEAALLTPDSVQDLDALAEMLDWEASGWPDFGFYAPLFQHAGQSAGYGAEVARTEAQRAFAEGAAAVFGDGAARFGLTMSLPEAQQATREAGQMVSHCDMLPPDILPGFVEAQRLRDAVLADVTLQAVQDTGGPVIVITGNGHARQDWGVPALLALAAPELRVFTLGQVEGALPDAAPYDLVVSADPVDRPDPCAAFR